MPMTVLIVCGVVGVVGILLASVVGILAESGHELPDRLAARTRRREADRRVADRFAALPAMTVAPSFAPPFAPTLPAQRITTDGTERVADLAVEQVDGGDLDVARAAAPAGRSDADRRPT